MTDWEARGCANLTPAESDRIFFPENSSITKAAKALCGSCDVRTACLAYGRKFSEGFGVWGGVAGKDLSNPDITDAQIAVMSLAAYRPDNGKRLSESQRTEIRRLREDDGVSYDALAKQFDRSKEAIRRVCDGRTYTKPVPARVGQLPDDVIRSIRRDRENGVTIPALAKNYGRATKAIHSIIHGLTYKHVA